MKYVVKAFEACLFIFPAIVSLLPDPAAAAVFRRNLPARSNPGLHRSNADVPLLRGHGSWGTGKSGLVLEPEHAWHPTSRDLAPMGLANATASARLEETSTRAGTLAALTNIAMWVVVGIVSGFCIACLIAYSVYVLRNQPANKPKAPPRSVAFGTSISGDELDANHQRFCDNAIVTAKYNGFGVPLLFLLPLNINEQFKKSANVYFLFMSFVLLIGEQTNLFDVSMNPWTLIITLFVLMGISVVMAGIDDWKRHRQDMETNNREVDVLESQGTTLSRASKKWQDLKIGDMVIVRNNNPFPADLVMLCSADESDGSCYVDTANLDGETNLKSKAARKESQQLALDLRVWNMCHDDNEIGHAPLEGEVIVEAPNNKLYTFHGSLKLANTGTKQEVLPLEPQQLLLRGTVLRNTRWCAGIVVYTGRETRMAMNAHDTPAKLSNLDKTLNKVMFLVIGVQAIIAMVSAVMHTTMKSSYHQHWYLHDPIKGVHGKDHVLPDLLRYWLTFFTLYSNLLPISLYSTLEMCNLIQARFINNDRKMYDKEGNVPAQVRATNLCQELGQVAYVFSDKTGTLTQNVMELKRVSINGRKFGELGGNSKGFGGSSEMEEARSDQDMANCIDAFLEVLSVSHTVVIDENLKYEAESPDEGALVQAAADLGWKFTSRKTGTQTCTVRDERRSYQELGLNAFNSKRKRMSLVVRNEKGEVWLLVKGADNIMLERAATVPPGLDQHIDEFARQGLRTLVLGRRRLQDEEVEAWRRQHEEAMSSMEGREEMLEASAENIEKDLEILGATAIEDKLQEDVDVTIKYLKQAGVKVWVLTGDKLDTAKIIGFSCAVLTHEMTILTLDVTTHEEMVEALEDGLSKVSENADCALMVTGQALAICLEEDDSHLTQLLLEVARSCSVLIACRVSPSQKADIVRLVRVNTYPTPVTLSIGDGANDVPMIQEAQVGVGISGKEGKQAANAADFSIGQFRFLQRLLLVHGRWNYRRSCKFILYSFYKNTVLVLTLFTYSFFCGQSGTSFYEDLVRNSFNIILALPIICVGVFEQDVSAETALKYPALYKSGRLGLDLNFRKMAEALLSALLHAVILVKVLAAALPGMNTDGLGGYYAFGTAAFSCLIMAMNYRAAFLTKTWNWISVTSFLLGSFGLYCVFLGIYGLIPGTGMYMVPFKVFSTPLFWLVLISVPLQAMAIDMLMAYVLSEFFPSEVDVLSEADLLKLSGASKSDVMQEAVAAINAEHDVQEQAAEFHQKRMSVSYPRELTRRDTKTMDTPRQDQGEPRSFAFSYPDDVSPSRLGYVRTKIMSKLPPMPTVFSAGASAAFAPNWRTGKSPRTPEAAGDTKGELPKDLPDSSKEPPDIPFLQQTLPSKQFVLTGRFVKWSLFLVGLFFVMAGGWALLLSEEVAQVRVQYDGSPIMPEEMTGKAFLSHLFTKFTTAELPFGTRREELHERDCSIGDKQPGSSRTCSFTVPVTKDMEPPIEVLYLVSPFYQNYNTYMRSVDPRQLEGQDVPHDKVKCREAVVDSEGHHLNPCGLQSQSFFNDTFEVTVEGSDKSVVDSGNIVFPSQLEEHWHNPKDYGRAGDRTKWLHERYPGVIDPDDGVKDPHFMVHMRPGALGYAQKTYGVINKPLRAGEELKIKMDARFPVGGFGGRKFLIFTTNSMLGGRNDFLGYELLLAGAAALLAAFVVALQQWLCGRKLGHWRPDGSNTTRSIPSPRSTPRASPRS